MDRPLLDLEIREPTGLRLGMYDLHQIRGMAYTGQVRPETEYLDEERWVPLAEHPALAEVFWLTGADKRQDGPAGQAKFGGWKLEGTRTTPGQRVEAPPSGGRTGLLGRLFGKR